MSTKLRVLAIAMAACVLTACASGPPTKEELSAADYGAPISQEDAEAIGVNWLGQRLKDPGSAQYVWQPVYKGYMREAPIHGGKMRFGYRLDGSVNAKNSFGGYTGSQAYVFMLNNGEIISVYGQDVLGSGYGAVPYMAKKQ